jgi:hypothetical protein
VPLKKDEPKEWEFDIQTPEGIIPCRIRMILSSNIKWIGWPREIADGTPLMFVEFMDGSRYVYFGVTRQKAVAAAYSESSGSYLAKRIKPKYDVLRIR